MRSFLQPASCSARLADPFVWEKVDAEGQIPSKRYGHTAVVHQDCMYIYGGYDDFGLKCNDIYCFDFDSLIWMRLKTLGPSLDRFHHSAVAYQGSMYVFGGFFEHEVPAADGAGLMEFRFSTLTWSKVAPYQHTPASSGTTTASAASTSGTMGINAGGGTTAASAAALLEPQWACPPPSPRWGHKAVVCQGVLYITGGCDTVLNFNDLYKFHFGTLFFTKQKMVFP